MTEGASVASRYHSYEDFWGRRCAQVFKQTDAETPSVDIYRFAPTWKVWAPAFGVHVYMTEGMASREMPPRAANDPRELRRVELCAYTRKVRESAPGMDAAALALTALAHLPWRNTLSLQPLETVTWGSPMVEGSEMSAFFLVIPPEDQTGLIRASGAQQVMAVMTVSQRECEMALAEGTIALVDRFEAAGIPPLIDWDRKSVV
jgi:hypothetical protein